MYPVVDLVSLLGGLSMPSLSIGVYVAVGGVLALLVLGLFLKSLWKVPEPNEALIISGFRKHDDTGQPIYRVVIGHGTFVLPIFYQVRRMSLQAMKTDLEVECVTSQGIQVRVLGVVVFKVGDTAADITNAARRFLDQQGTKMTDIVYLAFEGHLRSIVGGMTVETLLSDRDALTDNVRAASGADVAKLGLVIDSLTIREIDDPTGYIKNLAAPHIAQAEATARIARAQRGQQAAEAEAYETRTLAAANREAAILAAQAEAEQAKLVGTAKAEATRATGQAEADVLAARGKAEAAAIKARAEALAEGQEAVIAQQVAERLPAIVRAAAEPLGKIQNLTVLDGASGVTGVIGEVLGQVATILPAARGMFAQPTAKADGAELVPTGTTED